MLSEAVYRTLLLALMNVYVVALDFVPWVGRPVSLALCALVMAFTAVDAVWSARSRPLAWRVAQVEAHWPWFLGFGTIITCISFFGSVLVNAGAYTAGFPFLCLLAVATGVGDGMGRGQHGVAGRRAAPASGTPRLPVLWPFQWCALWTAKALAALVAARKSRPSAKH
jgi:hypothetical protein